MQTQVRRLIEYLKKREAGERIEEEELDFSNVLQGTQQATTPLTVTYVTKNRMNEEEQRTKTITDSVFAVLPPELLLKLGDNAFDPEKYGYDLFEQIMYCTNVKDADELYDALHQSERRNTMKGPRRSSTN